MILDKFSLKGKVAIVTGASRGLGEGMAIGMAEAGASVVVVASSNKINDTADKIKELGRKSLAIQA
ncbi:MAG: kduD, partial [Sporomusa sp.]|nr:kduD [Sporomusa sp.]